VNVVVTIDGGRRDQCPAQTLQPAADDQHAGGLRQAVDQGGHREENHPGDEQTLSAQQVRRPATQQQEAAKDQRVAVDHPLQVGGREVQTALDRRERDVDDGRVEDDHELSQAGNHQHHPRVDPAAGAAGRGRAVDRDCSLQTPDGRCRIG
jgi:hypothetical protein